MYNGFLLRIEKVCQKTNLLRVKVTFYSKDVGKIWNRHSNEPDIVSCLVYKISLSKDGKNMY